MKADVLGRMVKGALIGIIFGLLGGIVLSMVIDFFKQDKKNVRTVFIDGGEVGNADENTDWDKVLDAEGNTYGNADSIYGLEDKIFRFHVKANSNGEEDIKLKYAVRNEILNAIGDEIAACGAKDEVEGFIKDNLDYIECIAQELVYTQGYGYDVAAYVKDDYFPIRQYGEVVLPAGTYKALEIDIGNAAGENFWCMLYPMMCYPVDSVAVVSNEGEDKLRREISDEEYEMLFVKQDVSDMDIEVKFKMAEWLENTLFNLFE